MEKIEETNLPLPEEQAETQTSDELNAEELEAVAGGNAIVEGIRDFGQGISDGLHGGSSGESNLNYIAGNAIGGVVDSVGGAIKGK